VKHLVFRLTRCTIEGLLLLLLGTVALLAGLGIAGPALDRRPVVISGPSMEPAIGRGALVLIRSAGGQFEPGEIVTVELAHGVRVTHRITRTATLDGVPYVEVKGDANASPDPVLLRESAIDGRVDLVIPYAGYLLALLSTPTGIVACIAAGVFLLLLAWLIDDVEAGRLARSMSPSLRPASAPEDSVGHAARSGPEGAAAWDPRPGS
jgi:signal peptidase I